MHATCTNKHTTHIDAIQVLLFIHTYNLPLFHYKRTKEAQAFSFFLSFEDFFYKLSIRLTNEFSFVKLFAN